MRNQTILAILLASVATLAACGDSGSTSGAGASTTTSNGGNGGTAAAGGGGNGGTAAAGGGGNGGNGTTATSTEPVTFTTVKCQNQVYQCGDTIDNDGDGLIDWQDPDCLGPCDNTEDSYFGGIPGQAGPYCVVDCYWDSNSGSGNDECYWDHRCDPNQVNGHPEPAALCPYDPSIKIPGTGLGCAELAAAQSDTCADVCGPLTPNGCDCFGCCELPAGSGKHVWVGSYDGTDQKKGTCSIAGVNDPNKCKPCQPVPSCYNGCGKCELCIGKDPADIPPECNEGGSGGGGGGGQGGSGGGSSQCPPGVQACGLPGQAPCGASYYCVTGCCQPVEEPK